MNKFAGLILFTLMVFTANCFSKQAELEKQTAIAFYGKVVDQYGNAVEGAAINIGVKKADKDKKACLETITVKSDQNGNRTCDRNGQMQKTERRTQNIEYSG